MASDFLGVPSQLAMKVKLIVSMLFGLSILLAFCQ